MTTQREKEIEAEAAAWVARLGARTHTEADSLNFKNWLAADSAHGEAFETVNAIWELLGGVPADQEHYVQRQPRQMARRAILLGASALAVVSGGLALLRPAGATVYRTEVGEQKHVNLDDGSQAFLDTESCLTVDLSGTVRRAELRYGCVSLRVIPDGTRSFIIRSADQSITTNRSDLDLYRDGDKVTVVLIGGKAAVGQIGGAKVTDLSPGDRLIAEAGVISRDRPELAPLLAWRTGQAIFHSERLADAVAEMNRYSNVKIIIVDPAIADLRISGVYFVGDNASFAKTVAALLPIAAQQSENKINLTLNNGQGPRR